MTQHDVRFLGQISPEQVKIFANEGIKTIINNRPDGEAADQPTSASIAAAAKEQGIDFKEISFSGGTLTQAQVQEFADYFNQAQKPILMYCRTGNRSQGLYQAAKQMDLLND